MGKRNVVMKWIVIIPLILFSTVSLFANTYFTGGNLLVAANWTNGLPAHQIAVINSNGFYNGVFHNNTWLDGSTVIVGGGAILTLAEDLAVENSKFTVNDATINCADDFFCQGGNVILNAGSVTTANDDWEANHHAGRITVNGGTHSSGPASENYVGAQGDSTKIGCGIDFRGGTVIAGDFRFQINSSSSIGGGAILTSASPDTTIVDISGKVNFVSDWNGLWEVGSFGPGDWEYLLTENTNITFEGSPIDAASFAADFLVEDNGTTLKLASPKPIITVTYFTGGNLLDANNWTNGLPPEQFAYVNSNGYYNGVSQSSTWLDDSTVTVDGGAALFLTNDLAVFGSKFTVNNATINCSGNFVCDGGKVILNKDSVTTANGNWGAIDHVGRITVNGGTHSSGTNVENYVGALGDSTTIGCGIDFLGGTVIAGNFKFLTNSSSSISGGAILTSATPATAITELSGKLNFVSGWSGYWEVGSFVPGDWAYLLTNNANITLDGIAIDEARFGTNFLVESNGTTLKYSFPTFVTHFLGGDLLDANNWSRGLPAYQVAAINSNGYYDGVLQNNPWLNGSKVTVGGGAVLTLDQKLAVMGTLSFTVNDATINCDDDFFCDGGNVILNAGSVTTANDDWEANYRAGRITVNGGTHSSGTNAENFVGAQGSATKIGCGIDFRGGTVIAGDFRFQLNSSSSIGGGAILTSATPDTTIVEYDGNINFISDWSGLWEVGSFRPGDWENLLTGNTNITLDSTPIDAARFATEFIVSDDGTTLSYAIPECSLFIGFLSMTGLFIRRYYN